MVNLRLATTVVLTALILFSGYHLISHYADASANNKELKFSQAIYQSGSEQETDSPVKNGTVEPFILPKFQEIQLYVPELVGWIRVPKSLLLL